MNQYPKWKYILILVVVMLAALYALPNIYGQDPSVLVRGLKNAPVDEVMRDRVEQILNEKQLEFSSIELGEDQILVRFDDPEIQQKASLPLDVGLGENYTAALGLTPAMPDWLAGIGGSPMSLGLDLQGGVELLLQVDMEAALRQQVEAYVDDIRTLLRERRGIRTLQTSPAKDGVLVRFRTAEDRESGLSLIFEQMPELQADESETADSFNVEYTISPAKLQEIADTALQQNLTTLRNRVNELGVREPVVQQQGSSRIVVQIPGVQDSTDVKNIIGRVATLEYRAVDDQNSALAAVSSGRVPATSRLYYDRQGQPLLLQRRLIVSGNQLINASQGFDETGRPQVNVTLNSVGAGRMLEFTRDNVGKRMAVVFIEERSVNVERDGEYVQETRRVEEVISAATIEGVFGKRFRTTGLDEPGEAQELALLLRAGALAAPVKIIQERNIGPSLGRDNIERGWLSVKVGFVLVLVFMLVYYRLFGVVANIALLVNLALMVAILSSVGATLTLPGIAGIVLTVGMAVDANVLIFERIREELRNGNTPQASIRAGYDKALSTIADANITTLIAAIVLFGFGTGPIKGFAVTLSIGILTSMFTAIIGTRALVNLIYGRRAKVQSLAI